MSVIFFISSLVACFAAIMVISHKNQVAGALYLILCMCSLAVLFLLLQAQFIAVLQIIVYAGAITVLILFIVMLLNVRDETVFKRKDGLQKTFAVALGLLFLFSMGAAVKYSIMEGTKGSFTDEAIEAKGHVAPIAEKLFNDYLYPFEMIAVLLLVAMIGVVVLAKRD